MALTGFGEKWSIAAHFDRVDGFYIRLIFILYGFLCLMCVCVCVCVDETGIPQSGRMKRRVNTAHLTVHWTNRHCFAFIDIALFYIAVTAFWL